MTTTDRIDVDTATPSLVEHSFTLNESTENLNPPATVDGPARVEHTSTLAKVARTLALPEPLATGGPTREPLVYTDRDHTVSAATVDLARAALSPNTRRAYERQWRLYADWCSTSGRVALPATAETAAEYVAHLAHGTAASVANIEQALAAIRTVHNTAGHDGVPNLRAARLVLRGHRRERAETGARTRQAAPITVDSLRAMLATRPANELRGLRDRVVLLLGVAMFGRRTELTALELSDVAETEDGLVVYVRSSKTDQDAVGAEIPIPYGQCAETCPVRTVRLWRETLTEHGIISGRLLRSINRHGRIGTALTGKAVNEIVHQAAVDAGLSDPGRYTAHSLRAGGATIAAKAGHHARAIAEHGRWSATSPVVHTYIRSVDRWRDNPLIGTGL